MDSDTKRKKTVKQSKGAELNVSNVLPTLWVRFFIQADYGREWLLLGGRYNFLFDFRVFLAFIYFIIKTIE
jgi:hypothetical protein